MGTLADLEDQDPIPGKESPLRIHLKVTRFYIIMMIIIILIIITITIVKVNAC